MSAAACRRVVADEQYNDSTDAKYSRTLDERSPFTRSSVAIIQPMRDDKKPLKPHQWALIVTHVIGAIAIGCVLYGGRNT